jgi:hypothetical protein
VLNKFLPDSVRLTKLLKSVQSPLHLPKPHAARSVPWREPVDPLDAAVNVLSPRKLQSRHDRRDGCAAILSLGILNVQTMMEYAPESTETSSDSVASSLPAYTERH